MYFFYREREIVFDSAKAILHDAAEKLAELSAFSVVAGEESDTCHAPKLTNGGTNTHGRRQIVKL